MVRRWNSVAFIALCTLFAALYAKPAQAERIRDQEHNFSFVLPPEYRDFPAGKNAPKVLYSYIRGNPDDVSFTVIRLEALPGTIGREALIPAVVERAARESIRGTGLELTRIDYQKTTWRTFELDWIVSRVSAADRQLVMFGVQLPLAKKAIQFGLMGPATDEAKLAADMKTILASFTGTSSWLTDAERSERLGLILGLVTGSVLGLSVIVLLRRKLKRRAPPKV